MSKLIQIVSIIALSVACSKGARPPKGAQLKLSWVPETGFTATELTPLPPSCSSSGQSVMLSLFSSCCNPVIDDKYERRTIPQEEILDQITRYLAVDRDSLRTILRENTYMRKIIIISNIIHLMVSELEKLDRCKEQCIRERSELAKEVYTLCREYDLDFNNINHGFLRAYLPFLTQVSVQVFSADRRALFILQINENKERNGYIVQFESPDTDPATNKVSPEHFVHILHRLGILTNSDVSKIFVDHASQRALEALPIISKKVEYGVIEAIQPFLRYDQVSEAYLRALEMHCLRLCDKFMPLRMTDELIKDIFNLLKQRIQGPVEELTKLQEFIDKVTTFKKTKFMDPELKKALEDANGGPLADDKATQDATLQICTRLIDSLNGHRDRDAMLDLMDRQIKVALDQRPDTLSIPVEGSVSIPDLANTLKGYVSPQDFQWIQDNWTNLETEWKHAAEIERTYEVVCSFAEGAKSSADLHLTKVHELLGHDTLPESVKKNCEERAEILQKIAQSADAFDAPVECDMKQRLAIPLLLKFREGIKAIRQGKNPAHKSTV